MAQSAIKTMALVTLVSTSVTGCYSTWDLAPRAVLSLNGFHEGTPIGIETADGELVDINRETEFRFVGTDKLDAQFKVQSIEVQGQILTAIEQKSGNPIDIDLARMQKAQVTNFSPGKTALATGGVLAGGILAVPVGYVLAIAGFFAMGGSFGGGRPLRVAGHASPVRAPMMLGRARTSARNVLVRGGDERTRARLFAHWAKEASAESASVPAFLALARDLQAVGAPATLVRAVQKGAQEEVRHTELCTELCHTLNSVPLMARTPLTPPNLDKDRESLLKRLALEAFWDGCVAEGTAASVARRSAPLATDETTHTALQIIARDEREHAQLSQDILAYCLSVGGPSIRNAVQESLDERRLAEESSLDADIHATNEPAVDEEFGRAYGLAQRDVEKAARIEAWEKALNGWRHIAA